LTFVGFKWVLIYSLFVCAHRPYQRERTEKERESECAREGGRGGWRGGRGVMCV